MAENTITSANSIFILVVAGLFPAGVQLAGYAVDKAFMTDAADLAEIQMGVDGKMSGGFTPTPRKVTVSLQADSQSRQVMTLLAQFMKTAREIVFVSGTVTLPAVNEKYTLTRGILTNIKEFPDNAKTLQPQDYVFTFESINASPL